MKPKISLDANESDKYFVIYMNDKRWIKILKTETNIKEIVDYFNIEPENVK